MRKNADNKMHQILTYRYKIGDSELRDYERFDELQVTCRRFCKLMSNYCET